MRMIIHKPRRKAVCITIAGVLTGLAGEVIRGAEPPKNKKGLHPRRYRPFFRVSGRSEAVARTNQQTGNHPEAITRGDGAPPREVGVGARDGVLKTQKPALISAKQSPLVVSVLQGGFVWLRIS